MLYNHTGHVYMGSYAPLDVVISCDSLMNALQSSLYHKSDKSHLENRIKLKFETKYATLIHNF